MSLKVNVPESDALPQAEPSVESLRATIASLEAQLVSLYEEREAGLDPSSAAQETIAGLTAQVEEFYALTEQAGGRSLHEVLESEASLLAQVEALYAERDPAVR